MSSVAAAAATGFVFHSDFAHKEYQRVANKGRKNLRCFPHCRLKGHVQSGFCGAPLEFSLDSLPAAANGNIERVLTWGEFTSALAPPRFSPGDIVSEDTLEKEERSVQKPLNALFRGDLDELSQTSSSCTNNVSTSTSQPLRFQFNLQMVSYHCAWMPQIPPIEGDLPCFVAHVFLQGVDNHGQVTLQCLFSCRSQTFNIIGRIIKAKSKKSKPKAPVAPKLAPLQSEATPASVHPAIQLEPTDMSEPNRRRRINPASNNRKRTAAAAAAAASETIDATENDETMENQAEGNIKNTNAWWLRQPTHASLATNSSTHHQQHPVYPQGHLSSNTTTQQQQQPSAVQATSNNINDVWTQIRQTSSEKEDQEQQQQQSSDTSSFSGSSKHDGDFSSPASNSNMQVTPPSVSCFTPPTTNWGNSSPLATREFLLLPHDPPSSRVAMDDANTSSNPLASKRRRGAALAKSARWWIRTVEIRMRSISTGMLAVIQNDPVTDTEIKESQILYPKLMNFIIQHFAQEAHINHQATRESENATNNSSSVAMRARALSNSCVGVGGVGDSEGMDGVSGLFAEGELSAMFGSGDVASLFMDDTLWDLVDDEEVNEGNANANVSVAETETECIQRVQTNDDDYDYDNIEHPPTFYSGGTTEPRSSGATKHFGQPSAPSNAQGTTTSATSATLNDNKAFRALSSYLLGNTDGNNEGGITGMIDHAVSSIANEFDIPELISTIKAMFAYNLDMWTEEREKHIHALMSFMSRHVATVVNKELKARGVSHKDVIELASQLQVQLNSNKIDPLPFMATLARRVVGEYVDEPMPHQSLPVEPCFDLTGKWERVANVEAGGFTQEQLELTAAMNAISLDGDDENHVGHRSGMRHKQSPHATTSASQQYTLLHQQNALKIQGKSFLIVLHKAVIILDGVARSVLKDSALDDNLKDALAPRLRGWHTPDGAANIVMSMPVRPQTEVDEDEGKRVGSPHMIIRCIRTGLNTLSITTLVIRHHDTSDFVEEITRVYMQPRGIIDSVALSTLPGCSLLTCVTEEYSRLHE